MKCDIQDIVENIRQTPGFQNQIDIFIISALRFIFNIPEDTDNMSTISYDKLLQIASVFSMSKNSEDKRLAYIISIYAWSILSDTNPEILETIEVILSRLSNFPAINYLHSITKGADTKQKNNIFTQLEILGKRTMNSTPFLKNIVMTDFQKQLWDYLDSDLSVSFSAPTSAGKSFILKQFIVKKLMSKESIKILYILPTRALINEAITDLREYLKEYKNTEEILLTSIPTNKPTAKKVIYILTQERVNVLINSGVPTDFDLVVVDEAQQISSTQRGIILQDVIADIVAKNHTIPIVFSCPFVKNTHFFQKLFNTPIQNIKTDEGTVLQNLISVVMNKKQISLKLLRKDEILDIGHIETTLNKTSLPTRSDRLSFFAEKFTNNGNKSIIFANGPDDAEQIANKLFDKIGNDIEPDEHTKDLIDYIKQHLHKDFSLALMLNRGIAFHYGNLPTTIRMGIEEIFKSSEGTIKYLICTSTLLEGVNLPAKNIFIEAPKKGNKACDIISSHDFWNLAGRAGRLAKDLYGNIFLINYDDWDEPLANSTKETEIKSALYDTIYESYDSLIQYLSRESEDIAPNIESAVNRLYLEYKKNALSIFLGNSTRKLSDEQKLELFNKLKALDGSIIKLPDHILRKNPHISILKQQRLYEHFITLYESNEIHNYIPLHPVEDRNLSNFKQMMMTSNKYLSITPIHPKHLNRLITLAYQWMQGIPVSKMISNTLDYEQKRNPYSRTNTVVRRVLEWIEKDIRFSCMIRVKCYIDILTYVLEQYNIVYELPPIHLFMEMGASQQTRISLMGIGLSRPTANALNNLISNNEMSEDDAYNWLLKNFETLEQRGITGLTLLEIKKFI